MFHQEAFSVSNTTSGANTFVQITYITTNIVLPPLNSGVQVSPDLPFVHSVFGVAAHMAHLRLQSPKFLPEPYPTLDPNNRGTAFESPPRVHDFSAMPLPLGPTDEFDVFGTQNSGGTETQYAFVNFTSGQVQPVPQGKMFTVHGTSSTTLTAGAYTAFTPTLDQALPGGQYALIGARAFSATALAFRIRPVMANNPYRPGGVGVQAYDQMDPGGQRGYNTNGQAFSKWGVWTTFYQNVPPQVEVFATSADTAEEVWYDLVQISKATI